MVAERTIVSNHLGEISWDPANEILLPAGLPGFDEERRMLAVEVPAQRPLVYLQSVERPEVCFVALPARTILPNFEPPLSDEDRATLRIPEDVRPEIGADILCLALLFPGADGLEANLGAPIVVNLHNLRCLQAQDRDEAPRHYRLTRQGNWEPVC